MKIKLLLGICCITLFFPTWGATAEPRANAKAGDNEAQEAGQSGAVDQQAATRERKASKGTARTGQAAEVGAQHLFLNSLGSGAAIDVYRIQCNGPCTSCRADVADEGPFNDTNFKVCIIGSFSGATGTSCRISPQGGLSALASVSKSPAGSFRSFVTISEVNNAGFENYSSFQHCSAIGGAGTHTVTRILNQ